MSVLRIAGRYAKALIDLAQEQDKLEKIHEDVQYFHAVAQNREVSLLLKSPIIKTDKKAKIFSALFGDKLDKLTLAFFDIILKKGRESYLSNIADAFIRQYKKIKHISTVKLTTAQPISEDTVNAIKAKLAGSDVADTNIDLQVTTDENIIGGFILEFGDKLYNASIAHKLAKLRKEFSKNTYIKGF